MDNDINKAAQELLKDCLQQQIDEVEMLQSILCNPGEFKIDDYSVIADINDFIDGKRNCLNQIIDFNVNILLNDGQKFEIHFELPHLYPMIEIANFSIRTKLLPRIEYAIKEKICEFINEMDKSSVYIYQIITWIQDNYHNIVNSIKSMPNMDEKIDENVKMIELERLWIYLHHLKSTTKRQDILKLSKQLNLNGFSKPGKPGFICVEGPKEDTQEFWKTVRQWTWQRITIRLTETKTQPVNKIEQFYRFDKLKEALQVIQHNLPMEMSTFMKFLDDHKCSYVKKELLLLEL